MRDVFGVVADWLDEGRTFALATLVSLRQAATAPLGTTVAVDERGRIVGNIGAGCYESEIVEACLLTAQDGAIRVLDIDLDREDAVMGGTGCGAVMELVVWRPGSEFADDARAIAGGDREAGMSIRYEREDRGAVTFERSFPARDALILIGATALAAEIAAIARRLDYRVVVVDPRPIFATRERVPDADEIVLEWPQEYLPGVLSERTPIVMLSHDPKFDLPGLRCALDSAAPFIGLLGSRRGQASRRDELRAEGYTDEALARIHGPVGLDIGGMTAAETALSILAEIVAVRHQRDGAPLRARAGAIHVVA
jgi:xanthine dehydrogenase accessory factor